MKKRNARPQPAPVKPRRTPPSPWSGNVYSDFYRFLDKLGNPNFVVDLYGRVWIFGKVLYRLDPDIARDMLADNIIVGVRPTTRLPRFTLNEGEDPQTPRALMALRWAVDARQQKRQAVAA